MLKPQGCGDFLLHKSPPVFGKPWFWQRSSSTMESTRGLAQVIMEMRDEIKKLETENQELCGGHALCSVGPTSEEDLEEKEPFEKVENPYLNLRRNVSEPVLEGKFKGKTKKLRIYHHRSVRVSISILWSVKIPTLFKSQKIEIT